MSTRFWHYLRSNAGSETIHRAIFVDVETDDFERPDGITEKRMRFGWAAFVERTGRGLWTKPTWKRFTGHEEFWLWALTFCHAKKKVWMWCHNSRFDYPALKVGTYLKELGWTCTNMVWEAPPTIIKFRLGKRTLMLCDTFNIFVMSLKMLGEKIGLEKLEMPKGPIDPDKWDVYCRRDVEIILKAITEWTDFLRREDLGGFAPTIAGQAMRTFRHKYMDNKILIEGDGDALVLARDCYKGGRVECGFVGHLRQLVYELDFNSMYPFVMAENDFPSKLVRYTPFISIGGLRDVLKTHCVCAKVILDTNEPFAWVLDHHKLRFPIGKFDAWLTTPELSYAIERGFIRGIYHAAIYERAPLFRRFALDLYQQKEKATLEDRLADREHWKRLLNSFSGKWGQNGRHFKLTDATPPRTKDGRLVDISFNCETGIKTHWREFGAYVLSCTEERESRESHPAIVAHITAHARMVLWAIIKELLPQDYFYCDTDGVLTSETGFHKLHHRIDNSALGKLKHVKTYKDVFIYGCKDLILDGKRKCKGIRDDAKELDEGVFEQVRWYGVPGLARAGSIDMPLTRMITKTLRRSYDKGLIGPDGFTTPFQYPLPPVSGG